MLEVLMWLGFALLIAAGSLTFVIALGLGLHAAGFQIFAQPKDDDAR